MPIFPEYEPYEPEFGLVRNGLTPARARRAFAGDMEVKDRRLPVVAVDNGRGHVVNHGGAIVMDAIRVAARAILNGDRSTAAGGVLEGAIIESDEEVDEELVDALSMYSPFEGFPYVDYEELCRVIQRTLFGGRGLSGG